MACCCFLPARDAWQPLTVIQREQSAICHKKDRGFNKFGEERKGILLGRTDRFTYHQSAKTTAKSLDQLSDTLGPLAIVTLSVCDNTGHEQCT